jgi:predicted phosphoserine aminotransferase
MPTTTSVAPATAAGFGRFFLPGPTEVHPDVLAAQTRPMIGHRGKGMEELLGRLQPGLQALFRTRRPVYLGACSATGFMEGAIRNCGGRRVLALVNGAFSERFFRIARANGIEADALAVEWGQAHDPARVAEALARKPYDAVTVVHSETSTGVLNPVRELAEVCHSAGDVLLLVDSVTGVAGTPVEPDAWGLDLVLTGSQKALALPPGLALGVLQPPALARAERTVNRGVYFDFLEYEAAAQKHSTVNTPAISLLYALEAQLARIAAEGVEARWARHRAMAERTWAWVEEMRARGAVAGVLAPPGFRSPTVTCISLAGDRTGPAVAAAMKARGFVIGAGYGKLKDPTFRIGHMGDHTVAGLEVLLDALTEVLQ